jgi:hypothetical protein
VYTAIYDEAQSPDHRDISYIDTMLSQAAATKLGLKAKQRICFKLISLNLMRLSTSHHLDGLRVISVAGLRKAAPGSYLRQACALHSYQRAAV